MFTVSYARCHLMRSTVLLSALDFREWLGGEAKINTYTRSLALTGGRRVAEILGTSLFDQTDNSELTLSMVNTSHSDTFDINRSTLKHKHHQVNIKLPLPDSREKSTKMKVFMFFHERTSSEWNCYMPVLHFSGSWWTRLSAQVWNEVCSNPLHQTFFCY
jgi:hercynylcysteine S-oxide lyase